MSGLIISIIIVLVTIIIDFISKIVVMNTMILGQEVTIIPNLLKFRFVYNTGAAFSSMDDATWLLCIISLVASIGLGYLVYKYHDYKKRCLLSTALSLVMGGTIGNFIDRFLTVIHSRNGVVDFIELYIGKVNIIGNSTFNIADAFLVVGVILIVIDLIFFDMKKPNVIRKEEKDESINSNETEEVSNETSNTPLKEETSDGESNNSN